MDRRIRTASWGKILAAIFVVLVFAGQCTAAEFRGFWVDAWHAGALNQSDVDTLMSRVRAANCNAVVVQVRRNADALYPSSMGEPYMSGISPANFNGLQAVISAAHDTSGGKQRIEVHAWIVTFRTSGGATYLAHDDAPTGSLTTLDNYWPSRTDAGAETSDKAFDPGHPLCQEYTVNVAMDIVNNFDVDGIHYDYIRFTAGNQGYNPTSIARYNAKYGLTGQPSSTDDQFDQWRRDQISSVVRKVYAKIQASKPWVKQSGSFVTWNPSPTASTRDAFKTTRPYGNRTDGVFCDWDSWMEEGIVDAAIPMTYYSLGGSYPADWTRWINFEKDRKFNRHMYIGPGIYMNVLGNAITELQQTRTASPAGNYADGFCGYSYFAPYTTVEGTTTYGNWAGFAPTFTAQVTPTQDTIPDMPWKSSPTKGHISGSVTIPGTGSAAWSDGIYGTTVSITGPESRSMPCDGTGFYAFIDLTPGAYTVTASRPGYANMVTPVTVAIGSVTGNMYVTDFALTVTPKPIISNVAATGVTATSATISWTTDMASSSQVEYGLTTSYGSSTTLDPALVTSHSQGLTGLAPGTLYHYRVVSANANGSTTSSDYTFSTVGPPVISNVGTSGITNTAATVTWTTDASATTQVQYGLTTGYGSSTTLNPSLVTSHSQGLSGLSPNTLYHYRVISGNVNGTTTSGDYTLTTNGPPVITNVQATSIAATSATITWTTNNASDSAVSYGTTTSYGSQASSASQVTSHSVNLTGLTASTTYHYQCVSVNAYGTATTADYTFATTAVPVEIIVDDSAAVFSGSSSWTAATGAGYDSTYHYGNNRATNITRICTWTPTIATAGYYNVYCTYPAGGGTPTAFATFTVNYNGGSTSATFNQTSNTDVWQLVASSVPFVAGTSGNVVLNNMTGEANGSHRVTADAVKFVYMGSTPPPSDVIVDDVDTGATWNGAWTAGTYGSGYNNTYKFANTAASNTAEFTWTPNLSAPGIYSVYCWYTSGTNRTTSANYSIHYSGGNQTVPINQATGGAAWVLLATGLRFDAGTAGSVTLDNNTSGSVVVADAIKWVYTAAVTDTAPPAVSIGAPSGTLTRSGPITYSIGYSDDAGVSAITLASANVTLNKTGTANAASVNVTGSGLATRTVTISGITGTGTLGISIAAGTATDAASNPALAAGPSTTFAVDNTAPAIHNVGLSPSLVAAADTIRVLVNTTDNVAVTSVTANGTALALSGGSDWAGNLLALGPLGVHDVTIVATDTVGNSKNDTNTSYKTVQIVGAPTTAAWQPAMYSARTLYLFKFWGRVAEIDDDYFTLNDGSGRLVTVHAAGYKAKVVAGDYATARGVLDVGGSIVSAVDLITKY